MPETADFMMRRRRHVQRDQCLIHCDTLSSVPGRTIAGAIMPTPRVTYGCRRHDRSHGEAGRSRPTPGYLDIDYPRLAVDSS